MATRTRVPVSTWIVGGALFAAVALPIALLAGASSGERADESRNRSASSDARQRITLELLLARHPAYC